MLMLGIISVNVRDNSYVMFSVNVRDNSFRDSFSVLLCA